MALLVNVVLFFLGFLPAVALVSMFLAGIFGERMGASPDWEIGWNPILWLIMTAPWLLPAVFLVPVLHLLGKHAAKRLSRQSARQIVVVASPTLFVLTTLGLWGLENFQWGFMTPVAVAGLLYGAVLRIPSDPVADTKT